MPGGTWPATSTSRPSNRESSSAGTRHGVADGRGQVRLGRVRHGLARGHRPRRHPHRRYLRAGLDARRDRHRRAGRRQARPRGKAAGQHPGRGRGHGGGRPRAPRTRGVQSMIGFNYRRVPALALARELIAEGRLGTVRHVRAAYLQDWLADPESPMTWRLKQGNGRLRGAGRHRLATPSTRCCSSSATRSPRSPAGCTPSPRSRPGAAGLEEVTVDDAAWATLTLASGAIASVEVSRVATGQKNSLKLEIYGDKGALLFDLEDLNELGFLDATAPGPRAGLPPHPGQRTRAPLPWSVVAAGPHHRLGAHLHARDPGLPRWRSAPEPSRRRRSRTAWPSSGSWPPWRKAPRPKAPLIQLTPSAPSPVPTEGA